MSTETQSSDFFETGTSLDTEPSCWFAAAGKEIVWRDADTIDWLKRLRGYCVARPRSEDTIRLMRNRQMWIDILMVSVVSIILPIFAGYSAAKFNWGIALDVLVWVDVPIVLGVLIMMFATGKLPRTVLQFSRDSQFTVYRGVFAPQSFCLFIREPKGDHLVFFGHVSRHADWRRASRMLDAMAPVLPISPDIVFVAGTPFSSPQPPSARCQPDAVDP
ncbi:MAG: hypothetical protein IT434_07635 [Phycisphaerales bacterium]|nr:hypothetical protein [Phycisphaerales bacterium]